MIEDYVKVYPKISITHLHCVYNGCSQLAEMTLLSCNIFTCVRWYEYCLPQFTGFQFDLIDLKDITDFGKSSQLKHLALDVYSIYLFHWLDVAHFPSLCILDLRISHVDFSSFLQLTEIKTLHTLTIFSYASTPIFKVNTMHDLLSKNSLKFANVETFKFTHFGHEDKEIIDTLLYIDIFPALKHLVLLPLWGWKDSKELDHSLRFLLSTTTLYQKQLIDLSLFENVNFRDRCIPSAIATQFRLILYFETISRLLEKSKSFCV